MTFRYIGSKARLSERILDRIGGPSGSCRFVDVFCGTGAVAAAAAARGWNVHLNDQLHCAAVTAAARLIGSESAGFHHFGGYEHVIARLNSVKPRKGFIYREYSPASWDLIGLERRYFTTENAGKIDAIRLLIREWCDQGSLSSTEETLLLGDLVSAANRAANIAGTYGCFMRKWQAKALSPLVMLPRRLSEFNVHVTATVGDASVVSVSRSDAVYLDPPYTKRQYAAYYHLLETIVLGDQPTVFGVAGLRPWQSKASAFCYKTRALDALTGLIGGLPAERVFLSYSDNAHISIDALMAALNDIGTARAVLLKDIGRYRPNRVATAGRSQVSEYLFEVERVALEAAA